MSLRTSATGGAYFEIEGNGGQRVRVRVGGQNNVFTATGYNAALNGQWFPLSVSIHKNTATTTVMCVKLGNFPMTCSGNENAIITEAGGLILKLGNRF